MARQRTVDNGGQLDDPNGYVDRRDKAVENDKSKENEILAKDVDPNVDNTDSNVIVGKGQGGETPRERDSMSARRRPINPTPMAGAGGISPGGGDDLSAMLGGMGGMNVGGAFGGRGGLTHGGFGLPFDPQSNQTSDPISTLIQMLQKG